MSSLVRISALANESWTMTAIDHLSLIGEAHCTESTIAKVKCACCCCSVVVLVGLQRRRRLEHVAILSLLLNNACVRCLSQYLEHQVHNVSLGNKCFPAVVFQYNLYRGHGQDLLLHLV